MNSKNIKNAINGNSTNGFAMVIMIPFPRVQLDRKIKFKPKQIEKLRLILVAQARAEIEKKIDEFEGRVKEKDIDKELRKMDKKVENWNCDSVFMTKEDYEKFIKDSLKKEILYGLRGED